jgi:hypothetical protein
VLFFAAIAGAPLPFGSTDPRAIAFWCVVLGSFWQAHAVSIRATFPCSRSRPS